MGQFYKWVPSISCCIILISKAILSITLGNKPGHLDKETGHERMGGGGGGDKHRHKTSTMDSAL